MSIAAIQARTVELQSMIDSITVGRTASASTATTAQSTTQSSSLFGSALSQALAATSTTTGGDTAVVADDGSITIGGLSLAEFADAQVTPGSGLDVLQRAMTHLGVPYVLGGNGPSSFDCSGLVKYVMNEMGIEVPRTAAQQGTVGTEVASLAEAQPGDLVVTRNGGHIGIYVGGDQMLHAPRPGESVKIGKIYGDILTIRRLVPSGEVLTSQATTTAADASAEAALGRAMLHALSTQTSTGSLDGLSTGLTTGVGLEASLANLSLATLGSSL